MPAAPFAGPAIVSHDEPSGPFAGGPFGWLQSWLPRGRSPRHRACLHALVTWAVLWVPLAVLTALEGHAVSHNPREAFLLDLSIYGRYFIAAPVFVLAGSLYLRELAAVVRQVVATEIIDERQVPRYEALVRSTERWMNSRWVGVILLVSACVTTMVLSRRIYPLELSTWVAPVTAGERHISMAGWWRLLVSQPIFLTIGGVMLWRIVLWARFLARLTRMNLHLVASHPDRLGGLRFLVIPIRGFSILAFGIGAIAASSVAEAVIFDGRMAADFKYLIGAQVVFVLMLFAGPLLILSPRMFALRIRGSLQYGWLASELGRQFETRWLASNQRPTPEVLAATDFSATTDLYSVVANVRGIKLLVVDLADVLPLVIATLAPYVPVVFAIMPLDDVVRVVLQTVL